MQTVAAQTVLTWLDLLMYGRVIDVVHRQLDANRTSLELVELRFRMGLATALDVFQQRQAVARSESLLPPYEARLEVLRHELAALLGEPPRTGLDIATAEFPSLPPLPELGLPADLLARRPDVRAAGLRLYAADWQVSAARAERLPAIRLTPSFGFEAGEWDLLLDNWMARLAASVAGPVFDAGRRKAEVVRARAAADERLAAYKQAVVTAVKEVENALANEAKQAQYVDALRRELEAAEAGHTEALARYRKGLNDYLPVLSALSNAQTLERGLVFAAHDQLVYRVQLHLALGGDWMAAAAPEKE
jgi:NodT family efflux transporter outer membrane factor (OMF) lipoprotein